MSGLDKAEFEADINRANMSKVKIIAVTFIVLEVIRLLILHISEKGTILEPPNVYYFAMYLLLIAAMLVFLAVFIRLGKNISAHRMGIPVAGISFTAFLLLWCAGISLLDQLSSYGQIIVYVMAIISIAVVPLFKPLVFFLLYVSTQGFFLLLLPYVQKSAVVLQGHFINTTLFLFLAFVIAQVRYRTWVKDYKNKKIIQQKSEEITKIIEDI
jgi:hypothetical protein